MRSRRDDVDPALALARAVEQGVCGVGGRLPREPLDEAEAVLLTEETYGERAAARLRRFVEVPVGASVWTRHVDGSYRHGVLTGPWRWDGSSAAVAADLVHVRDCRWDDATVADPPGPVAATFARGGRNFQRIRAL